MNGDGVVVAAVVGGEGGVGGGDEGGGGGDDVAVTPPPPLRIPPCFQYTKPTPTKNYTLVKDRASSQPFSSIVLLLILAPSAE